MLIAPPMPERITKGRHPVDDERANWHHGTTDPDQVYQSYLNTHKKWLAYWPELEDKFCEHGKYVGGNRALAYMCPFCPEV